MQYQEEQEKKAAEMAQGCSAGQSGQNW